MSELKLGESSGSISKATIADLKAITAEHVDQFSREGRSAVKGKRKPKEASKNPFDRPSPGLLKRLAVEARNDAKRRHFADDTGPNDDQRRAILKKKAKMYEAMMEGDLSGLSEKQIAEMTIDFDRKRDERSTDEDSEDDDAGDSDSSDDGDGLEQVEYEDEMGRTRVGTRKEAQRAQAAKRKADPDPRPPEGETAYAEVQKSTVIFGEQNMFPVYEPDAEVIREKYRAAEEESRAHHYDSTKEVRAKGAGQYQFALDEEERAAQMAALKAQRVETEEARTAAATRTGLTAGQEARKRKLDDRRAAIEAKRRKLLGGEAEVARLRAEKRAAEADKLLDDVASEMHKNGS